MRSNIPSSAASAAIALAACSSPVDGYSSLSKTVFPDAICTFDGEYTGQFEPTNDEECPVHSATFFWENDQGVCQFRARNPDFPLQGRFTCEPGEPSKSCIGEDVTFYGCKGSIVIYREDE